MNKLVKMAKESVIAAAVVVILGLVILDVLIKDITIFGLIGIAILVAVIVSFERHHKAVVAHHVHVSKALENGAPLPHPPTPPMTVMLLTGIGHALTRLVVNLTLKAVTALREKAALRRSGVITVKEIRTKAGRSTR